MTLQPISATKARNDFFNLLNRSFREKKGFIIEKSKIPVAFLIPANAANLMPDFPIIAEDNAGLIQQLKQFHKTMKMTSDSVEILRQFRQDNYYA